MREVELNEGLQKIGRMAFVSCPSLKSIKLPSTVTEIGINAFSRCRNLREVTLNIKRWTAEDWGQCIQ